MKQNDQTSDQAIDQEAARLPGLQSLWLLVAVLVGVALAFMTAQPVFRSVPTDISRIGIILDALNDDAQQPNIAVFGNSVAMTSLNAEILSERLPGEPLAYNLATTGQSLIESYLYYQELPDSVDTVIQFIKPDILQGMADLNEQKYNTFYMYGYRPDVRTYTSITETFGPRVYDQMDRPAPQQLFDSRWAIRQSADRAARSVLRADMELDRSIYDLQYPTTNAARLPEATIARAIRNYYDKPEERVYEPAPRKVEFFSELVGRARDKERQYIFVLAPVNPGVHQYRTDNYYDEAMADMALLNEQFGVPIIDVSDLVPAEYFSDAMHPMDPGATLVSNLIVDEILRMAEQGQLYLPGKRDD